MTKPQHSPFYCLYFKIIDTKTERLLHNRSNKKNANTNAFELLTTLTSPPTPASQRNKQHDRKRKATLFLGNVSVLVSQYGLAFLKLFLVQVARLIVIACKNCGTFYYVESSGGLITSIMMYGLYIIEIVCNFLCH